jgi:hypothetical protein
MLKRYDIIKVTNATKTSPYSSVNKPHIWDTIMVYNPTIEVSIRFGITVLTNLGYRYLAGPSLGNRLNVPNGTHVDEAITIKDIWDTIHDIMLNTTT